MCGIVGVVQYKSKVPREIRERALRVLFSRAMMETEPRGEDATGLYQIHDNGDWLLTKKGLKVTKWLYQNVGGEDDAAYRDIMDSWEEHPRELSSVIGHCRKATIGSKGKDNNDNHPFAVQVDADHAILGIHNGTLKNHELIFKKLPNMLERQGKVDSEAIFHMLFHMSGQGQNPFDGEMIKQLGMRLDGAFACITSNTLHPNIVATFRQERPMEFFMIAPLNMVLVVSERKYGISALNHYEFCRKTMDYALPELTTHDQMLGERCWRIFDTTKEFPTDKMAFGTIDKISSNGTIRPINSAVHPGWEIPKIESEDKKETSNTSTPTYQKPAVGKVEKTSASMPGNRIMGPTAQDKGKDEDDTGVVIEVELSGTNESKIAFTRSKSLGAAISFDTMDDLCQALGQRNPEVSKMAAVQIANFAVQLGFNTGYAAARFDAQTDSEGTLSRGRILTRKLERSEVKATRAQKHVWEAKQLMAVMHALESVNRPLTVRNIKSVLGAFPKLGREQQESMLDTIRIVYEDKATTKLVRRLRDHPRIHREVGKEE